MKKQTVITNRQLTFSLVAIVVGSGILSLPRIVAEKGYQDGWLVVIMGSLIPLLGIMSILLLFKRFPGRDFLEICELILGKYLGRALVLLYVIYSLLFGAASISAFSSVLSTYILPLTPKNVIVIFMIAVALYIINGGIKVVARFNELTLFIFLPLLIFLLPSLKEAEPTFMLPVLSTPAVDLLSGSYNTSWSFLGMEYLLILYPFVKNKEKAMSSSLVAYAIVTAIYIYVVIVSNMVFGPYAIKSFIWPVLVLLKVTDIQVLERIEFFFILMWVGVAIRPMLNQLFASSYLITNLFGIRKFLNASIIMALAMLIIQYFSNTIIEMLEFSDFVGIVGIAAGTVLPIFLLILSFVFRRGTGKIRMQQAKT